MPSDEATIESILENIGDEGDSENISKNMSEELLDDLTVAEKLENVDGKYDADDIKS